MHHRPLAELPVIAPAAEPDALYSDAAEAVAELKRRYAAVTAFLRANFAEVMAGAAPEGRYRAFYPSVEVSIGSFAKVDSRLSFGHVTEPGRYVTSITRPSRDACWR